MPFAPTRNNRVAPRKRTLTSPTPTVKDGMVRRGRPARPSALPFLGGWGVLARTAGNRRPVSTPMSAPSVKTGTARPPRPQARISAKTIKVEKQPFIGVKASPLRAAKKNQKKSR